MSNDSHDLIFYEFSRSKIERGDFTHFLGLYGADKLPSGRCLRDLMDCFVFCIEGWGEDPREIHMIPEIRRFYSAFHDAWPYWLYFCKLEGDMLKTMILCCLPSVNTMQVDGQTQVAVTYEPLHLIDILRRDLLAMNVMCEQGGMFEDRIFYRTKAVFEYFGLPFDQQEP